MPFIDAVLNYGSGLRAKLEALSTYHQSTLPDYMQEEKLRSNGAKNGRSVYTSPGREPKMEIPVQSP